MNEKLEIRASAAPWHCGVELLALQGNDAGTKIILETFDEGVIVKPTLVIKNSEAQTLIDDLWRAGFRPTEGSGSAGSLRATEKHLADMRTIAFKKLNINQ